MFKGSSLCCNAQYSYLESKLQIQRKIVMSVLNRNFGDALCQTTLGRSAPIHSMTHAFGC